MSFHNWTQWTKDNPDWSRDYSDPSTMPGVGEVGDWRDKLRKTKPLKQKNHILLLLVLLNIKIMPINNSG